MRKLVSLLLAFTLLFVYTAQFSSGPAVASGQPRFTVVSDAMGLPPGALSIASQSSREINITFSLDFSNASRLNSLLSQIYTPGSSQYHHFLSPAQFYARFAPSSAAVTGLENYMNSYGAKTAGVLGDGTLVSFTATESQLHGALGVSFYSFSLDGGNFYSSTGQPTLPYLIASTVSGIQGLQDYAVATHPALLPSGDAAASPSVSVGPSPSAPYNPATIKEAYNFTGLYNSGIDGSGVSVSIVTAYTFSNSTIQYFDSTFGISPYRVVQVMPFGVTSTLGLESTLDTEWMTAIVPGATVNVVIGPNPYLQTFTKMFDYVVSNNLSSVMSTSWGTPESGSSSVATPSSTISADNSIFKQAAAEGIGVTTASGDYGAYDNTTQLTPDFPSSSPYVTGVGGTWLNLTTSGGHIVRSSETGWSKSGGGVSSYFPAPAYQSKLPGSMILTGRGVPDVSFNAMPAAGYYVYYNGSWVIAGGTSFGAPIWSGILGLENQLRASAGEGNIGFANPALYSIALSANYNIAFYDITQGYNGYYSAGPGYDLVTGLGVPDVYNLDHLLASIPVTPLSVKASATPQWGDSPMIASLYANVSGGFAPYGVSWYLNGSTRAVSSSVNYLTQLRGAGIYRFKVTAVDNLSESASAYVNVTVYSYSSGKTGQVTLSASPSRGDANLAVSFSASTGLLTAASYYLYAFGDSGVPGNTTSGSIDHTYTGGGNYTVLVTAFMSQSGAPSGYYTLQAVTTVNVAPHLKAIIIANRTGGSYPLRLRLEASNYGGTPGYTFQWSYTNETGTYSSSATVLYLNYTRIGTYTLTLSVKDSLNSVATTSMAIRVYRPMAVNLSISPSSSGVSPFTVTVQANITGGAGGYTYNWTFGSTSAITGNPVTYTFQNGGTQNISLTVTDLAGDTSHANMTVRVQSVGLLNLLKGETAFIILGVTVIVAAAISYSIARRRKL